jgi:hypothetical protein
MRRALPIAVLLLGPTLLAGCNACQALCGEMYDYALECGIDVPKEQLKECRQAQANANTPRSERAHCRDYFDEVRAEWTCEDLAEYWDGEGGQQQPQDTASSDLCL